MPRKKQSERHKSTRKFSSKATVVFANNFGAKALTSEGETLSLKSNHHGALLPGDKVELGRIRTGRNGKKQALVQSVEPQDSHRIVGILWSDGRFSARSRYLEPVGIADLGDINVNGDYDHIEDGQIVSAIVCRSPSKRKGIVQWSGTGLCVLDNQRAVANEIALTRYGIRPEWPVAVLQELEEISESIQPLAGNSRRDLRATPFITIDPASAEDFDDAVYCEATANGFQLCVAIADVSHFVQSRTAIDREAYKRGTSIYLSDKVVPMLPQKLSNNLCSLQPDEDRLALVCEMNISKEGVIDSYQFFKAIIRSAKRLTYQQAAQSHNQKLGKEVSSNLESLKQLHQSLLIQRRSRNSLELNIPEPYFMFDNCSNVKAIGNTSRNIAHSLIEESMLAANVCAADLVNKHLAKAGMYRIHDPPTIRDAWETSQLLKEFGIDFPEDRVPEISDYANAAASLNGNAELQQVLQIHLLRSLQKAVYSDVAKPHFALNFPLYTHFTSPIRRYPDLLVHRLITGILQGDASLESKGKLSEIAKQSSYLERRADSCTRESSNWLKNEYMKTQIGETFEGTISDVKSFGLFVQLHSPFVDGLIPVEDLGNEFFDYISSHRKMIGRKTGTSFAIGDSIRIRVSDVNIELGYTYFRPENFDMRLRFGAGRKWRKG